jgi:hypothetical protein
LLGQIKEDGTGLTLKDLKILFQDRGPDFLEKVSPPLPTLNLNTIVKIAYMITLVHACMLSLYFRRTLKLSLSSCSAALQYQIIVNVYPPELTDESYLMGSTYGCC